MSAFKDLTGQRFGRLVALYPTEKRSKGNGVIWLCHCDCGNLKEIVSNSLLSGVTKSCGCLQKERVIEAHFKHGDSIYKKQVRFYNIWLMMNQRCLNPNATGYKWYGGRGISICNEWKNSYRVFRDWAMANGYADNLTIDRIDNEGNYNPDNCQWITQSENSKKPKHKERKAYGG